MTARATITEAELRRAVKVALGLGMVVRVTRGGAYIVPREDVPVDELEPPDKALNPVEARRARRGEA